jgi:chaperonin GroES
VQVSFGRGARRYPARGGCGPEAPDQDAQRSAAREDQIPEKDGERRTTGGILIPATAQVSKRLVWAEVVALGQNVRSAEVGDQVLFSPDDRYEVEVGGSDFIMLRERDLHAVAASRIEASTGLYL